MDEGLGPVTCGSRAHVHKGVRNLAGIIEGSLVKVSKIEFHFHKEVLGFFPFLSIKGFRSLGAGFLRDVRWWSDGLLSPRTRCRVSSSRAFGGCSLEITAFERGGAPAPL